MIPHNTHYTLPAINSRSLHEWVVGGCVGSGVGRGYRPGSIEAAFWMSFSIKTSQIQKPRPSITPFSAVSCLLMSLSICFPLPVLFTREMLEALTSGNFPEAPRGWDLGHKHKENKSLETLTSFIKRLRFSFIKFSLIFMSIVPFLSC